MNLRVALAATVCILSVPLPASAACTFLQDGCPNVEGGDPASTWYCDPFPFASPQCDAVVDGDEQDVQGSPDTNAHYSMVGFEYDSEKVLVLDGTFAEGRFENVTIDFYAYNEAHAKYYYLKSVVVNDFDEQNDTAASCGVVGIDGNPDPNCGPDIQPAANECNPATNDPPSSCFGDDYQIAIVDGASASAWQQSHPETTNTIPVEVDAQTVAAVRVTWRYYTPDGKTDSPPPGITWKALDGSPVSPPTAIAAGGSVFEDDPNCPAGECASGAPPPCTGAGCTVNMYRPIFVATTAPNPATEYLATTIKRRSGILNNIDLVVFTWQPPDLSATGYPAVALSGNEDMRYWSFCIGNGMTTDQCVTDSHPPSGGLPASGKWRLIVGPPNPESVYVDCVGNGGLGTSLATCADRRGDYYLSWGGGVGVVRVPLYRNTMVTPNWAGRIYEQLAPCNQVSCPAANAVLGDYGPIGKHCLLSDYSWNTGNCDS